MFQFVFIFEGRNLLERLLSMTSWDEVQGLMNTTAHLHDVVEATDGVAVDHIESAQSNAQSGNKYTFQRLVSRYFASP